MTGNHDLYLDISMVTQANMTLTFFSCALKCSGHEFKELLYLVCDFNVIDDPDYVKRNKLHNIMSSI